jgi:hypothetical protein
MIKILNPTLFQAKVIDFTIERIKKVYFYRFWKLINGFKKMLILKFSKDFIIFEQQIK